jgi:hypothetical protein
MRLIILLLIPLIIAIIASSCGDEKRQARLNLLTKDSSGTYYNSGVVTSYPVDTIYKIGDTIRYGTRRAVIIP